MTPIGSTQAPGPPRFLTVLLKVPLQPHQSRAVVLSHLPSQRVMGVKDVRTKERHAGGDCSKLDDGKKGRERHAGTLLALETSSGRRRRERIVIQRLYESTEPASKCGNLFAEHRIDFHQIVFHQLTVYDGCKRDPSILLSKEKCFDWVDYSEWCHGYNSLAPLVHRLASINK